MTVMTTAVPGAGPVMEGAAGPAGGAGPGPAGGFHDAVAEASDPFGRVTQSSFQPGRTAPPPLRPRPRLWAEQLAMLAAGVAIITGLSLVRSRARRRRGWGMLPARSVAERLWP
jgi:hypothetical protein